MRPVTALGMFSMKRTRFLKDLDQMVMIDRQGAIDDMLQVLRECKVIETAYGTDEVDKFLLLDHGPDYRYAARRGIANLIGSLLLDDKHIAFTEREVNPVFVEIKGTVEVVKRKR
jgi:hypothetical protein